MAFALPTFNLTCSIWTGPFGSKVFRLDSPCNLAAGRRNLPAPGFYQALPAEGMPAMTLLLPPGTDVRDNSQGVGLTTADYDLVEVPKGSGRWYVVLGWDDMGKGFDNEHRFASLAKTSPQIGSPFFAPAWPVPGP